MKPATKNRSDEYQLAALKWTAKGWEDFGLGEDKTIKMDLNSEPERLEQLRCQPGRAKPDFLVFYGGGRTRDVLADRQSRRSRADRNAGRDSVGRCVPRIGVH